MGQSTNIYLAHGSRLNDIVEVIGILVGQKQIPCEYGNGSVACTVENVNGHAYSDSEIDRSLAYSYEIMSPSLHFL